MEELKRKRSPSPRGLYLFTWGVVYTAMGILFALPPAEPTNPMFAIVFGCTGLLALISSYFHRLDTIAFSGLVGATAFRALWHWFDLSTIVGARPAFMFIWTAVAVSHFIVAKWPYITDKEIAEQAATYKELYERMRENSVEVKSCPNCGKEVN